MNAAPSEQRGLLDPRPAPLLHRRLDPPAARAAARGVAPRLTALHERVLAAFADGPRSARELERPPCFADLGFSTVRKRVCELQAMGRVVACGEERSSGRTPATVYRLAPEGGAT